MAKQRKRRAHRPARERPERDQDARLVATRIVKMGNDPAPPDTWAVVVSPIRMDDGRMLNWHPPQAVAFHLIEAKRLCDRAVPKRRRLIGNLATRPNESYGPPNSRTPLDILADLTAAVLFAFTAIESLANHSIDQLDVEAMVTVERGGGPVEISRDDMVRRLGISEKLTLAVPMLPDGEDSRAPNRGRDTGTSSDCATTSCTLSNAAMTPTLTCAPPTTG
jgi:hypothetical protein